MRGEDDGGDVVVSGYSCLKKGGLGGCIWEEFGGRLCGFISIKWLRKYVQNHSRSTSGQRLLCFPAFTKYYCTFPIVNSLTQKAAEKDRRS